ncbi:MAG: Clp protease ClpP [Neomegalonema sp.]|nr:Clp protease ClpP [Neomegalonema sp.]
MSLRAIETLTAPRALSTMEWQTPKDALARWDAGIRASESDDRTISFFDVIGSDGWGGGIRPDRISAQLRELGDGPVTVLINSPGGSFFDGVAIYNMLARHKGAVTVEVVGIAASAASVIAMAGDEVIMSPASFLMIHNAWCICVGNRHALQASIKDLEQFDGVMRDLYAGVSGQSAQRIETWMDDETFFGPEAAIEAGLADSKRDEPLDLAEPESAQASARIKALRQAEAALAAQGKSRSERRALLKNLSEPEAAQTQDPLPEAGSKHSQEVITTPGADEDFDFAVAVATLQHSVKG